MCLWLRGLFSGCGKLGLLSSWAYSILTACLMGFSLQRLLLLGSMASRACGLQQRQLQGSRAQALWSQHTGLAAPRPVTSSQIRVEPTFPALAGRFSTTESPGSPHAPFKTGRNVKKAMVLCFPLLISLFGFSFQRVCLCQGESLTIWISQPRSYVNCGIFL